MSGHTKWSELRDELGSKPGAQEAIARARQESAEELRLYELRHGEAVSQVELAGRLEVTQGAISKFEHADDVRISTLRQYLAVWPIVRLVSRKTRYSRSGEIAPMATAETASRRPDRRLSTGATAA